MDWLTYDLEGKIRDQELSPELLEALGPIAEEMGLTYEVFSGGQGAKGTTSKRTGSTRHDHGHAADLFLRKDGQRLDWANPEHLPTFEEFVANARAAGLTGIGAGPGYMQPGSMHVGFGNEAVWGAGGKGANAPDWLREAYYGAEPGATPTLSTRGSAPDTGVGPTRTRAAAGLPLNVRPAPVETESAAEPNWAQQFAMNNLGLSEKQTGALGGALAGLGQYMALAGLR